MIWNLINHIVLPVTYRNCGHNNSFKIKIGQEDQLIQHWIPNLPLKVIIHGWLDSTDYKDGIFRIKSGKHVICIYFITN